MPYPWKIGPEGIPKTIREEDMDTTLQNAKQKLLEWSKYKAGLLERHNEASAEGPAVRDDNFSNKRMENFLKTINDDVYK